MGNGIILKTVTVEQLKDWLSDIHYAYQSIDTTDTETICCTFDLSVFERKELIVNCWGTITITMADKIIYRSHDINEAVQIYNGLKSVILK